MPQLPFPPPTSVFAQWAVIIVEAGIAIGAWFVGERYAPAEEFGSWWPFPLSPLTAGIWLLGLTFGLDIASGGLLSVALWGTFLRVKKPLLVIAVVLAVVWVYKTFIKGSDVKVVKNKDEK